MEEEAPKRRHFDVSSPLKVIGIGLIIHYLYTHPPIQFNPLGILYYFLFAKMGYQLARWFLPPDNNEGRQAAQKLEHDPFSARVYFEQWKKNRKQYIKNIILVPGEDGLFVLPLLYIGINVWSAMIAALIFGFVHYLNYAALGETRMCYGVAVAYFFVIMVILPMGILTVAVAHSMFYLIPLPYQYYKAHKISAKANARDKN